MKGRGRNETRIVVGKWAKIEGKRSNGGWELGRSGKGVGQRRHNSSK